MFGIKKSKKGMFFLYILAVTLIFLMVFMVYKLIVVPDKLSVRKIGYIGFDIIKMDNNFDKISSILNMNIDTAIFLSLKELAKSGGVDESCGSNWQKKNCHPEFENVRKQFEKLFFRNLNEVYTRNKVKDVWWVEDESNGYFDKPFDFEEFISLEFFGGGFGVVINSFVLEDFKIKDDYSIVIKRNFYPFFKTNFYDFNEYERLYIQFKDDDGSICEANKDVCKLDGRFLEINKETHFKIVDPVIVGRLSTTEEIV